MLLSWHVLLGLQIFGAASERWWSGVIRLWNWFSLSHPKGGYLHWWTDVIPPEKGMNTQKRIWERQFLFPKNHVEQVHVKFPGYGILEDFRHGVFWWRDSENIEDIATLSQSIQGIPPKTAEVPIALNRIITSNHSPSRIKLLATCDGPFW